MILQRENSSFIYLLKTLIADRDLEIRLFAVAGSNACVTTHYWIVSKSYYFNFIFSPIVVFIVHSHFAHLDFLPFLAEVTASDCILCQRLLIINQNISNLLSIYNIISIFSACFKPVVLELIELVKNLNCHHSFQRLLNDMILLL